MDVSPLELALALFPSERGIETMELPPPAPVPTPPPAPVHTPPPAPVHPTPAPVHPPPAPVHTPPAPRPPPLQLKPRRPGVCQRCKTRRTPLWRRGPNGPRTLCNACGVWWTTIYNRTL